MEKKSIEQINLENARFAAALQGVNMDKSVLDKLGSSVMMLQQ